MLYMELYLFVIAVLFFVFCIGTIFGSFLNVVILRAFSGESIVLPPSKCPKCSNRLKWWHNIPIISYILLKGKCYFCHEKISVQYPVVEFITGCLFVAIFMKFGLHTETFFACVVASLLIVIAVTDIKERIVFDAHTYLLIATGLIYNLYLTITEVVSWINTISGFQLTPEWCLSNPLTMSLLGLILGGIIMEIAARAGYLIAGERAFGQGDTYIAAGLGAVFGWKNIILIIILSIIIQVVFTLPLFIKKLISNRNWQTLTALCAFFVYAAVFYILDNMTDILERLVFLIPALIIMLLLGILVCFQIITGLKNKEKLTYIPFGPAMAITGCILLVTSINFSGLF